jgi:hypothetical protein
MRKHQSLIPNEKALAVTKAKKCRMSKLPDVNFHFLLFSLIKLRYLAYRRS